MSSLSIIRGGAKEKQTNSKEPIKFQIREVRNLQKHLDPDGLNNNFLDWLEGRWHVFSGDNKAASFFYKKAFSYSLYNEGKMMILNCFSSEYIS